jgi:hypothetical protein
MTFKTRDNVISIYTKEQGVITSVMRFSGVSKELFYIEFTRSDGSAEYHIYSAEQITPAQ